MNPLIIIDMQSEYEITESKPLLNNIIKHIQRAIKRKNPVIIVELRDMGLTKPEIMNALSGYSNYETVIKDKEDGSKEIQNILLKRWDIQKCLVNVCGIFSDDCIAYTVRGLIDKGFSVNVIEEACASSQNDHESAMWSLNKLRKCQVVHQGPAYRNGPIYKY